MVATETTWPATIRFSWPDLVIVDTNHAMDTIMGERLVGRALADAFPNAEYHASFMGLVVTRGEPVTLVMRPLDMPIPYELVFVTEPVTDGDGQVVAVDFVMAPADDRLTSHPLEAALVSAFHQALTALPTKGG